MPSLLGVALSQPLEEPEHLAPPRRYDEARGLSTLDDGRACVEAALSGETVTATWASGEQDDRDLEEEDRTITEANAEVDTWASPSVELRSASERRSPAYLLGTQTAAEGERDSFE